MCAGKCSSSACQCADSLVPELVLVLTGLPCLVADNVMVYKPGNFAQSEIAYRYIRQ